jgi:hypothetical protein
VASDEGIYFGAPGSSGVIPDIAIIQNKSPSPKRIAHRQQPPSPQLPLQPDFDQLQNSQFPETSLSFNTHSRSRQPPLQPTVFDQLQDSQFPEKGDLSFTKLHPSVENLLSLLTNEHPVANDQYFFQIWTWESLDNITLKNLTVVSWLDLYFQDFNPRFPIFSKSWILENYKNMPMFLLKVLYLHTLAGENVLVTDEINNLKSNLFAYLKLKFEYALDDQGPFTAIGSFLLGRYAYDLGGFDDFARGCIMVCGKIKKQLGIGFGTSVQWRSHTNIIYQMDTPTLKLTWSIFRYIFCDYCYTFGHIMDPPFFFDIHVIDMFEGGDSNDYTFHFVQNWKHHNELLFISKKISLYAYQCRDVKSETTKILLNELETWFHELPIAGLGIVHSQRAAFHNQILYHNMKMLLLWPKFVNSSLINDYESIDKKFEVSLNTSLESIRVMITLDVEKEWCPSSFYFCVFITGTAVFLSSAKGKTMDLKKRSVCLEILENCGFFPDHKKSQLRKWKDDPAKLLKYQSFWELNLGVLPK